MYADISTSAGMNVSPTLIPSSIPSRKLFIYIGDEIKQVDDKGGESIDASEYDDDAE
jgi:hypothetical protein